MCERVTDKREVEGDGSNEVGRYSVSLLFFNREDIVCPGRPRVFVPSAPGSDASSVFMLMLLINGFLEAAAALRCHYVIKPITSEGK